MWVIDRDQRRRECVPFFYCPVCSRWQLFQWGGQELHLTEKQLDDLKRRKDVPASF
jgi:hypothetical protein